MSFEVIFYFNYSNRNIWLALELKGFTQMNNIDFDSSLIQTKQQTVTYAFSFNKEKQ